MDTKRNFSHAYITLIYEVHAHKKHGLKYLRAASKIYAVKFLKIEL